MVELFSGLSAVLGSGKISTCFVDTTVLFSATYPLDSFNEECEKAFNSLADNQVKILTNVNVRAEFLENHRRVLIAECLIDLLEDEESGLDGVLLEKLKAHRTSFRRKTKEEKSAKMDLNQIKIFRKLLSAHSSTKGSGWEIFCIKYLMGRLTPIWSAAEEIHQINFVSVRSNDKNEFLNSAPKWEVAESLMGRYGLASSDAMILNMFLCSRVPVLLTADLEMAEVADKESKGSKRIFVPDSAISVTQ